MAKNRLTEPAFSFKILLPGAEGVEEALSARVFELGSTGLSAEKDKLAVYFPGTAPADQILAELRKRWLQLAEAGFDLPEFQAQVERVPHRDWASAWKEYFRPVEVAGHFVIVPPWERRNVEGDRIRIVIDPGQAFGTGTHETTQLMLRALLRELRPGDSVLDVGTGSGILAIAAAHLGAGRIVAYDADPVAVESARKNLQLNRVGGCVQLFVSDSPKSLRASRPFDLVLANLLTSLLIPLLPDLVPLVQIERGRLVLSGILAEEREKMTAALKKLPLRLTDVLQQGEWIALICERRTR